MSIRPIVTQDHPILRMVAEPIAQIDDAVMVLLNDMAETMYAAEGVGLAAVQVNELYRIIVYDVGEGLVELINPVLLDYRGEQYGPEGCLSIPGLHADIRRYEWVRVQGQDRFGQTIEVEGEELLARCLQHEIDHLNGILFIDYIEEENFSVESLAE
ncbi:MAG: def [Bacilli bacterium]|nr:def [Bacilli bacterium]